MSFPFSVSNLRTHKNSVTLSITGLSEGRSDDELKRWRESEVKHGRICMLAAIGMPVAENWNPLFGGKVGKLTETNIQNHIDSFTTLTYKIPKILGAAIYHFQQADVLFPYFWLVTLFFIGLAESQSILVGWQSPREVQSRPFRENSGMATLKTDYVPGDLGFDPLNLRTNLDFEDMRTKELQNGRLAMLAVVSLQASKHCFLHVII